MIIKIKIIILLFVLSNMHSAADSFHHFDELLERDLSISILVDLLDDRIDGSFAELISSSERKDLLDFVGRDNSRAVLVEHLEGSLQFFVCCKLALIHGCDHEFRVVNEATLVGVN